MPFVTGFLRLRRRRGRYPDQGLPGEEEDQTPEWGLPEGEDDRLPERPVPEPPPGIWPGPTPGHPIVPVPPEEGPGQGPELPPGAIWPKPPGDVGGKFVVLAIIPGYGWRYIVIEPGAWPEEPPAGGIGGTPPGRPTPQR
jgi:hypothetical protein